MIPANRLFLGLSLVLVLLSTLSYTLTGTLDAWLPLAGEPSSNRTIDAGARSIGVDSAEADGVPRGHGAKPRTEGIVTQHTAHAPTSDGAGASSNPNDHLTHSTGEDSADGSTAPASPPKDDRPASRDEDPASPSTPGTISGSACPCTVTGTAELVGRVDLRGDLVVDGGTLVARPGVTVHGNGFQIVFMKGGRADFRGSKVPTWSNGGRQQNLTRDVVFEDMRRIMFHSAAGPSVLKYFSVIDSGTSALGDYPIHFHLNGNSTRGTIVEGVVVLNGKHHAFVPHGSHGITFRDTIARNTRGEAYWWDDPGTNESCSFIKKCTIDNSNDITYDHALAHGVSNGPSDSRGFRLSGFKLGAGSGNVVVDSAAVDISPTHVKDCAGFAWPESANQNVGGNVWRFTNNYSHSSSGCHGIFVWQNDNNDHVINGFSGSGIDHGAYKNRYAYRNVNVPALEIHAVGWSIEDSKAGSVVAKAHTASGIVTFRNVTLASFTIDDAKGEPAEYVLDGTNLQCSDIVYASVASGSFVTIDGVRCDPGS